MSAMTVVIINDASLARGGATGLALFQAKLLRARGFRVVFVTGDDGSNPDLAVSGVEVRPLGGTPLMKASRLAATTRGMYNPAAREHVTAVIAEVDSPRTVYHVHGFSKTLTSSVLRALASVRTRVFLHAHDYFLACPNGGYMDYQAMEPCHRTPLSLSCLKTQCDKRSYPQKLWRTARQAVVWSAMDRQAPWAGVLMIHPGMAAGLQRGGLPAERLISVRNPATAFRAERIPAEHNHGAVFVGRIEAEKGVEDLIAAAGIAGVGLTVIGDGPLRDSLAARHPNVAFPGWMSRDQIGAAVAGARVLVMPSRYPEPFGLVAAEASLSGLPVIVPQTALLGPEVAERGLGLVCNTRDPAQLADALRHVEAMPQAEVAAISERGHAGACSLASTPDSWIDAQLALYQAALAQ